jgi:GT2 family glycosyltransferase
MKAMAAPAIDIVVAVYNASEDLRACVESVLAQTRGDYSLVLIDDASTDPAVRAYFEELAPLRLPQLVLLRNERNLGFTATANIGMARSRADVVLLNSDTIVTSGWLDALLRCAASDDRIGTITPFSNNAEICSFPRFCRNNVWPQGADPEPVRAALAAAAVPCYPDIPTGVGFCMYVRRALLDAVGSFDCAFGAGYGEENDLCLRAAAAGFRNVLCDDAFVLHTGGRSFEDAKSPLAERNMPLVLERHPHYLDMVRAYIERDPLASLREAARTAYDRMHGASLGVVHVMHGGGGTEAHVRGLIEATRGRVRHMLATVRDRQWRVEEHRTDGSRMDCEFGRREGEAADAFLRMLCATWNVGLVHLHNISGSRDVVLDALPKLGVPYGYTVHDLNFACPTITLQRPDGSFCGGVTDIDACGHCLAGHEKLHDIDIADWRARHGALLARASFVIAPSRWAGELLARYFPGLDISIVPHASTLGDSGENAVKVVLMPESGLRTVAVLGAIGPDKGARRIERLAQLAAQRNARVRFVVIGYLDRRPDTWQSDDARLTVHGPYASGDLPRLLDYYDAKLVLFPSSGPETFSFTLSEAWSAGRAVLVPPIGALAERVRAQRAGWVMTEEEWRDDGRMLDRIVELLSDEQRSAVAQANEEAARIILPNVREMVEATLAIYRRATEGVEVVHPPVDRLRVVEAFGYRRWIPPAPDGNVRASGPAAIKDAESVPRTRLGHAAIQFRRTAVGRALSRLMPLRFRAALKARIL